MSRTPVKKIPGYSLVFLRRHKIALTIERKDNHFLKADTTPYLENISVHLL